MGPWPLGPARQKRQLTALLALLYSGQNLATRTRCPSAKFWPIIGLRAAFTRTPHVVWRKRASEYYAASRRTPISVWRSPGIFCQKSVAPARSWPTPRHCFAPHQLPSFSIPFPHPTMEAWEVYLLDCFTLDAKCSLVSRARAAANSIGVRE